MEEKMSIDDRYKMFANNTLPGEDLAVYWLLNDLKTEYDQLRARNAELEAEVARYKSNIDITEAATGMCGIYAKLEAEVALLRKAHNAILDLINSSQGVYGLHLNGDGAPWESLRTGGQFEAWLLDFDAALEASDG